MLGVEGRDRGKEGSETGSRGGQWKRVEGMPERGAEGVRTVGIRSARRGRGEDGRGRRSNAEAGQGKEGWCGRAQNLDVNMFQLMLKSPVNFSRV